MSRPDEEEPCAMGCHGLLLTEPQLAELLHVLDHMPHREAKQLEAILDQGWRDEWVRLSELIPGR